MHQLTLEILPQSFAICRLSANAAVPSWADNGVFAAITRTAHELSVVCLADAVPADVQATRDWRALRVVGTLDFALTGILSAIAAPLAHAQISIFAVSTYDTDYVLVREATLDQAIWVLQDAGHHVTKSPK